MFKRIPYFAIISMLVLGLTLIPAGAGAQPAAQPASPASDKVSPEGFINEDGTLRLDGSSSGQLDLSGWNVQLDPKRGPLFAPPPVEDAAPLASVTGSWASMGGGGPTLNGYVYAVAVIGSDAYVGGTFYNLNNDPTLDFIARWDGSSWHALSDDGSGGGSVPGQVQAITVGVNGTDLYVGGWFNYIVNSTGVAIYEADYIAKYDTLTGIWDKLGAGSGFNGPLNSGVLAIAVSGTDVYAGGYFQNVHNSGTVIAEADYAARYDADDGLWYKLGDGGAGVHSLNNLVNAIAVIGTNIYFGGSFQNVQNGATSLTEADFIARWDGTNWNALSSNGVGDGSLSTNVHALAVSGTDLYVGGGFSNVNNGGTPIPEADYIAKWDTITPGWSKVGDGGTGVGSLNSTVMSLAFNGSDLYAGGFFSDVNNGGSAIPEADYIAKFSAGSWSKVGDGGAGVGSLNESVRALAAKGSGVVAGGYFYDVNNGGTVLSQAAYVAEWDGTDWLAMGPPQGSVNKYVYAVTISGSDVYVGGSFTDLSDGGAIIPEADYIARWDGSAWHALGGTPWGLGSLSSDVVAIAVSGTDVYAGGYWNYFYDVSGNYHPDGGYVAHWDGSNWLPMGNNGDGCACPTNGSSLNAQVQAIALSGTDVYVGGWFTDVKDASAGTIDEADYIAKWNGSAWSAVGDGGPGVGSLDFGVRALAFIGTDLYAGGDFTNVKDGLTTITEADYIAKWDTVGEAWSALGDDGLGDGSIKNVVAALAVSGTNLYAGGYFEDVADPAVIDAADFVAKWNGSSWSALGSDSGGDGSVNGVVFALAVNASNVYIGGPFTDVENPGGAVAEADYIANWDGTQWSALGNNGAGDGPLNKLVWALAANGTHVYPGGEFYNLNNGGAVLPYGDFVADFGITNVPLTFKSQGGNDGWVLESTELSGMGGSTESLATTFRVGDDAANKQYRSIVSFDTSALPDTAVITKVTLKVRKYGLTGTDPFTTHGGLIAAIRQPYFGSAVTLANSDFQASHSKQVGFSSIPVSNWYSTNYNPAIWPYVSLTGTTQFKLRFTLDDNDDLGADYVRFYSGNASMIYRPQLIIEYYVP